MPITLRHNTQQQSLPSAASYGLGMPVSDGGAGAIANALDKVAGAAGNIGARLQQKESDGWQVEAKRRFLAARNEMKQEQVNYTTALDSGDEAAQKAALSRISQISNYEDKGYTGLNAYGDPDNEVPEKYLEQWKGELLTEYQDIYYKDKSLKQVSQNQTAYEETLKGTLGALIESVVDNKFPVASLADTFLQQVGENRSLGFVQNSIPASREPRERQILGYADAMLGTIDARVKNETDSKKIEALLEQGQKIVTGLEVNGSPEEKKLKDQWLGTYATLANRKASEDGFMESFGKIDATKERLLNQQAPVQMEQWAALAAEYAAVSAPEETESFKRQQSSAIFAQSMATFSDPTTRAAVFRTFDGGESPNVYQEGLSEGDQEALAAIYRGEYKKLQQARLSGDPYASLQVLSPKFAKDYQYAWRAALSNPENMSSAIQAVWKSQEMEAADLSDYAGYDFNQYNNPPFVAEVANLANDLVVSPEGFEPAISFITRYMHALESKEVGVNPSIVADTYLKYENPLDSKGSENVRELAQILKLAHTNQGDISSIALQSLITGSEELSPGMKDVSSRVSNTFSREDSPIRNYGQELEANLKASGAHDEAALVSVLRETVQNVLVNEHGGSKSPEAIASMVNDELAKVWKILPGGDGLSSTVVPTEVKERANIRNSWVSAQFTGGRTRKQYVRETAAGFFHYMQGREDVDVDKLPIYEFSRFPDLLIFKAHNAVLDKLRPALSGAENLEQIMFEGVDGEEVFRFNPFINDDETVGAKGERLVAVMVKQGYQYVPMTTHERDSDGRAKKILIPWKQYQDIVSGEYIQNVRATRAKGGIFDDKYNTRNLGF